MAATLCISSNVAIAQTTLRLETALKGRSADCSRQSGCDAKKRGSFRARPCSL